jgi:DNA-binding transcriptional ArsR family regulator
MLEVLTISRPEQLKALGHPIRLRALSALGDGEPLTNRELALRLGVDPGHLHFHVRMLVQAGLIEPADGGRRREKPYRAVARRVRVAPELLASGPANDVQAAMLNEVHAAWTKFAGQGKFRSAQLTVRIDPERARELMRNLAEAAGELESDEVEPLVITLFAHPQAPSD